MGTGNKENVQLIISHVEGCSGNFLGYLSAEATQSHRPKFRVDVALNEQVLSINGRTTWLAEIETRLVSHSVVVTHNYNRTQIQETFPNARLVQIYPYTHIGNVLYNICYKKLDQKLENAIDNYFLDICNWFDKIKKEEPDYHCANFWCLRDKTKIESLLGITLSPTQHQFFDQYWKEQLPYELDMPQHPMTIGELVKFWKIENGFSSWAVAWTIFVYEHINRLEENNRLWTINDAPKFDSWDTVIEAVNGHYNSC